MTKSVISGLLWTELRFILPQGRRLVGRWQVWKIHSVLSCMCVFSRGEVPDGASAAVEEALEAVIADALRVYLLRAIHTYTPYNLSFGQRLWVYFMADNCLGYVGTLRSGNWTLWEGMTVSGDVCYPTVTDCPRVCNIIVASIFFFVTSSSLQSSSLQMIRSAYRGRKNS